MIDFKYWYELYGIIKKKYINWKWLKYYFITRLCKRSQDGQDSLCMFVCSIDFNEWGVNRYIILSRV